MDVIIVNTDQEIRELQKKPPTTDASTQTHFTTDISLLEVLLKNSTQILQLLQQLPKRKNPDQLEETNNPSLVEYLQSENIDFLMVQTPKKLNPGQQTSVLSEPVPLNSTELTDLSIQPLSTNTSSPAKSPVSPRYRGLSASPEAHPLSPLSPSPTPVCPGTLSPECSPIFPELCRRVQQTTTTFNSTQIQPSVPSQPFTILNHPIQHFSHPRNLIYNQLYTEPAPSFSSRTSCRPTTECFSAPITEISSNTAPIGNNEIRIAKMFSGKSKMQHKTIQEALGGR
ncbi:mucin-2-like [Mytilus trossulus]|uniref:mucin-2-like n=1 Tax=Mytilus trossulus TaxID=6551 RepID=UPI0030053976